MNDVGSSPQSNNKQNSLVHDTSLSPHNEANKLSDRSIDKGYIAGPGTLATRAKPLPKINNPQAENRLKALMDLLGKKNPVLRHKNVSSAKNYKDIQEIKSLKSGKQNIFLPPLTPTAFPKNSLGDIRKNMQKSPSGKVLIKIKAEDRENQPPITKLVVKRSEPVRSELPEVILERDSSAPVEHVEKKKRVVFQNIPQNNNEERTSIEQGEKIIKRKNKFTKFLEIPHPEIDFDSRIHRVSIDDALERLNQLTNQSNNARKDLLKVQENALAIRLRYERSHKSLDKINSERDLRKH